MTNCEKLLPCIYASIWIGLIWIMIIPFEIYVTINLYRHRHHAAIIKRYPSVVIGASIFSITHQLICETFYYLESGINLDIFHENSALYIAHILFPPLLLLMIVIIVFRIYLIHFDINYAVSQSTRDWQSLLSDTVNNDDFYTRYHTTLGNWKYVSKYFIIYVIIGSTMDMMATIAEHPKLLSISHDLSRLIYVFWLFIMVMFAAYLFIKTPKFEDVYFMKKELKYLLYLFGSCLSIYIVMVIFSSDTTFGRLANEIQISSMTIANFGAVMISEYIILIKIKRSEETAFNVGTRTRSRSETKKSPSTARGTLFNVLIASPVGIDFFVKHLRSEFAIENLLCFIELIQWIYLCTNKDFSNFDVKPLDKIEFELSSSIPLSSANNQYDNNEWNWQRSILLIYEKYIHSSAEYQVNLPYDVQNGFNHLINLLKIQQQIINKSYVFKHGAKLRSSSRRNRRLFWDKKDKKDKKTSSLLEMNMLTITEDETVNHNKLHSNPIHNGVTPLSVIKYNNTTSVATKVVTFTDNLQNGSFPEHQSIFTAKVSAANSFSKSKSLQKKFNKEARSISSSQLKSSNKCSNYSNNDSNGSNNSNKASFVPNYSNKASSVRNVNNSSNNSDKTSVRNTSNKSSSLRDNSNNSNNDRNNSNNTLSVPDVVQDNQKEDKNEDKNEDKGHLTVSDALQRNGSMRNQKGFVFVDEEYDGKECKDPEISCTAKVLNEIFQEEMCRDSVIDDNEDRNSVIIPSTPIQQNCLKPCELKIENSIVSTVKQSFRKLSILISSSNNDSNSTKSNELYLKELEQYENAKKLDLNQFISIVCQSLHIILQLNYQSISRFKQSQRYIQLLESVNLNNLIEKHGNKGC